MRGYGIVSRSKGKETKKSEGGSWICGIMRRAKDGRRVRGSFALGASSSTASTPMSMAVETSSGWIEKEKKVALLREAKKDLRRTEREREREREDEEEWTEKQRRKTRREGERNGERVWDRLREKKEWFCRRE